MFDVRFRGPASDFWAEILQATLSHESLLHDMSHVQGRHLLPRLFFLGAMAACSLQPYGYIWSNDRCDNGGQVRRHKTQVTDHVWNFLGLLSFRIMFFPFPLYTSH